MEPIKAVENRRSDGTFGAGNNANPAGRPKGKSLKEYWRARFADMTDEEKLEFSSKVAPELIFRMAEGNPAQDNKHEIEGEIIITFDESFKKHVIAPSTKDNS